MAANRSSKKSRAILKGIAEGRSFGQILAGNPSVTYHDIFRAAAEAPACRREQKPARVETEGWPRFAPPVPDGPLAAHTALPTAGD